MQTVKWLVATGSLSAGGDRAGGPRGWRRRRRAARERARKKASGDARARIRRAPFTRSTPAGGPPKPTPGPRQRAAPLTPCQIFPIRQRLLQQLALQPRPPLSKTIPIFRRRRYASRLVELECNAGTCQPLDPLR